MSTVRAVQTATPAASSTASRMVSIDIFRGLTIAVMIFVNELAEVRGLPWWTYHAHANQDAMTYVDMVFPFFLFIVGMSMPLSVEQRLKRNASMASLWLHVVARSLSLLVLGLILANDEKADPALMGRSGTIWGLMGLIGAGLYLNVYPRSDRGRRVARILRPLGLVAVVITFAIFRRTTHDGHPAWIDFSYPEILGLIGFAYFAAAVLYIPTRRWRWAAPAWLILLTILNMCSSARLISTPNLYVWPFGNGSHVALVLGGIVTAQIFFGLRPGTDERPAPRTAILIAMGFATLALVAGWMITPLGISKIRATPTWTLWNIGAAVLMFTLLYWVCDLKGKTGWAALVHPAGANTLTTYLLPDMWYFLLGLLAITWTETHFNFGWPGVARTIVFTLIMLGLAAALTRAKVRLRL
jgi:predicted acyltransferase